MARLVVYALRWSARGGTWTRGYTTLPFPLSDAIASHLAVCLARAPFPGFLFLFAGANPLGATVIMPALKKPYPT